MKRSFSAWAERIREPPGPVSFSNTLSGWDKYRTTVILSKIHAEFAPIEIYKKLHNIKLFLLIFHPGGLRRPGKSPSLSRFRRTPPKIGRRSSPDLSGLKYEVPLKYEVRLKYDGFNQKS